MLFSKAIDIEDFNNEELHPYLLELAIREMAVFGIKKPSIIPDSKNWETAMSLYSFAKHDVLKEGNRFAGIGAGTEVLTEILAEKGAIVFPVDRYLAQTAWSDVAPPGYMVSASEFSKMPINSTHIIPVHSDARALDLPSNFFDGVYSSGSIEHLGGLDAIEAASSEIARILKPGGYASLSTELWLDGPEHLPWFDDNCILFTPALIEKHIVKSSGLVPIGMPHHQPSPKTFATRKILIDFLNSAKNIRSYKDRKDTYPNLVLFHEGFLFCSVHILLQKPVNFIPNNESMAKVDSFRNEIKSNNLQSIEALKGNFSPPNKEIEPIEESPKISISFTSKCLRKTHAFVSSVPWLKSCVLATLKCFPKVHTKLRNLILKKEN